MLKNTRPHVGYLSTLNTVADPVPGSRDIQTICMLKEELDFYLLKFVDEEDSAGGRNGKNMFKIMRSSVSSRKSVERISRSASTGSLNGDAKPPNLTGFGPQIKQVCQAFFRKQLKVQTMSDFPQETKPVACAPLGSSSFSRL
jgi:hypothetical protein